VVLHPQKNRRLLLGAPHLGVGVGTLKNAAKVGNPPNQQTHAHLEPQQQILGDGSKPWYLLNPKIAGKWMFIPLTNCIYRY